MLCGVASTAGHQAWPPPWAERRVGSGQSPRCPRSTSWARSGHCPSDRWGSRHTGVCEPLLPRVFPCRVAQRLSESTGRTPSEPAGRGAPGRRGAWGAGRWVPARGSLARSVSGLCGPLPGVAPLPSAGVGPDSLPAAPVWKPVPCRGGAVACVTTVHGAWHGEGRGFGRRARQRRLPHVASRGGASRPRLPSPGRPWPGRRRYSRGPLILMLSNSLGTNRYFINMFRCVVFKTA